MDSTVCSSRASSGFSRCHRIKPVVCRYASRAKLVLKCVLVAKEYDREWMSRVVGGRPTAGDAGLVSITGKKVNCDESTRSDISGEIYLCCVVVKAILS